MAIKSERLDGSMDNMISVIIPIYNSAPFLKECVASVLKQTYKNFELLLITDGSTDGSEELCRRFARRDRRIRFLPQTHKGVSSARNAGLELAAGEYLFFLDSDDVIHPQLLERLMRLREKTKAAVISENFCRISSQCFEREASRLSAFSGQFLEETYQYLDCRKALDCLISDCPQGQLYAIGGKLINRTAARKIRFDEALLRGEDTKYMYQLFSEGADAAVLSKKLYYYRIHRKSRSAERTVEACRSMYASDKYIWLQEKRKGRELHARRWEEKMVRKIAAWHAEAHMKKEHSLMRYTLSLVKKEPGCLKAEWMGWRTKLEYRLAFYCYPAYQLCHVLSDFLKGMKIV